MPTINRDDDRFTQQALTRSINALPYHPDTIGELGIFEEEPIPTTGLAFDLIAGRISLIPHTPRGAPGAVHIAGSRSMVEMKTAHFLTRSTLLADSVQDRRAPGDAGLDSVDRALNVRLAEMRLNLEQTIEHQRMGAIKGLVVDSTGAVLEDLAALYGIALQSQSLDLSTTTTHVPNNVVAAIRKAEMALGRGSRPSKWIALAAPDLMDDLRAHASIVGAVAGWNAAAILTADHRAGSLVVAGVEFIEYISPEGGPVYVGDGDAYLIPVGVPGLFQTKFAPPDYVEHVNSAPESMVPIVAKAEPLPFDRGWAIEAQTNPISFVSKPRAVVKLTKT